MRSALKLVIGTGILAVFSPGLFAASCTAWSLGNGTTTIAPGTSATGSPNDPCTLGGDTFSNFYVFNTATSDTDIVVGVSFTSPAVMTLVLRASTQRPTSMWFSKLFPANRR